VLGKHRRLIEATTQEAPAMDRHRDDQIRVGEQFLAGSVHPARKERHAFEMPAPLEPQDQPPAPSIIA